MAGVVSPTKTKVDYLELALPFFILLIEVFGGGEDLGCGVAGSSAA